MKRLISDIVGWLMRGLKEKEEIYETTILRDIEKIGDLIVPEFPFDKVLDLSEHKELGVIIFDASGDTDSIRESIPLKSLHITSYSSKRYHFWRAELDEYNSVYNKRGSERIRNFLGALSKLVEKNCNNIRYQRIFIKYEDSVHVTYNTLKEYHELNGDVELDSEVAKKAHVILNSLKIALEERESEIAELSKKQREASNRSYLERLDQEVEYIRKYVE